MYFLGFYKRHITRGYPTSLFPPDDCKRHITVIAPKSRIPSTWISELPDLTDDVIIAVIRRRFGGFDS